MERREDMSSSVHYLEGRYRIYVCAKLGRGVGRGVGRARVEVDKWTSGLCPKAEWRVAMVLCMEITITDLGMMHVCACAHDNTIAQRERLCIYLC